MEEHDVSNHTDLMTANELAVAFNCSRSTINRRAAKLFKKPAATGRTVYYTKAESLALMHDLRLNLPVVGRPSTCATDATDARNAQVAQVVRTITAALVPAITKGVEAAVRELLASGKTELQIKQAVTPPRRIAAERWDAYQNLAAAPASPLSPLTRLTAALSKLALQRKVSVPVLWDRIGEDLWKDYGIDATRMAHTHGVPILDVVVKRNLYPTVFEIIKKLELEGKH